MTVVVFAAAIALVVLVILPFVPLDGETPPGERHATRNFNRKD